MHPRLSGHALDPRVLPERTLVLDHNRVRDSGGKCSTLALGTRRTNSRNAQTDTTVVIPTYNESANIGTLVERLSMHFVGAPPKHYSSTTARTTLPSESLGRPLSRDCRCG